MQSLLWEMCRKVVARTKALAMTTMLASVVTVAGIPGAQTALAATNPAPQASVSFTFDDGLASIAKLAAPTLKRYGLSGTSYVTTKCVGMIAIPNTCRADRDKSYMTWAQIQNIQNNYGWEIGSHTVTHRLLASSDPTDGQPNPLTLAEVRNELTQSKSALQNHGLRVKSFATPYGDYNTKVIAEIAKVYSNHRGFADTGLNDWPYNEYLLYNLPITSVTTVASVKAKIDEAIAQKKWLVITFHDIVAAGREGQRPLSPSPGKHTYSYDYSNDKLAQIAAYVAQKRNAGLVKNLNPGSASVSGASLFANSSFASGISSGWTTDAPAAITANHANTGSFPSPKDAVKLTSTTLPDKHLYSPQTAVSPTTSYALKAYLNVTQRSSGYVGLYIDEYNTDGAWISGQYAQEERTVYAENLNSVYRPSSSQVASMRLQIYIGGGTLTAFIDNIQLIPLSSTPLTNLLPNAQFDSGLSGGWTTDSAKIVADTENHGAPSGEQNSLSVRGTAGTETHIFSPRVPVVANRTYSIASYLSIIGAGGDSFGYYIDEYDISGNWVSGQYKLSVTSGAGDRNISYTPSSTSVTHASLQFIVPANDTAQAYFDWARWYQN